MKRVRNTLPILLSLVILSAVFGGVLAGEGGQKVTLRIMWWGSKTRHDRTLQVIEMYTKKNPNVTILPEFMGGNEYWQKLNTLVASNDLPDIFQIGNNYLTYKDYIEPMDRYINDGTIDVSNTTERFLSTGRVKGRILGLSLGTNAICLLYDPEIFKKAGVPLPTENWTWVEFEDAAIKIHQKLGIFGSSKINVNDFFLGAATFIPQHGKNLDVYNKDSTGLGYKDDKLLADYFAMKLRLTKAGAYPRPDELLQIKDIEGDFLVSGKAAMTWVWSNQVVAVMQAAKRPLGIAPIPRVKADGPSGMCVRSSQAFSVAKSSKYKKEAMKFINYFVNDIEANKVLMAERGVPIMSTVREALKPYLSPEARLTFDYMDLVGRIASKPPILEPPAQLEIEDVINRLSEEVGYERITPAEAAARFRREVTEIFRRTAKR